MRCCNELENPIGIETRYNYLLSMDMLGGCNELENPIGIETLFHKIACNVVTLVATNLKTR